MTGILKTQGSIPNEGPDFLCIGMGKAGTGWLYDQCAHHPDFWMPPIKEIHYLDREQPNLRAARRSLRRRDMERYRTPEGMLATKRKQRKIGFMNDAHSAMGKPMDLELYASLFRHKDDLLSGDISPSYCAMPDHLIKRVMARFPNLKIIMLLRDPVSRAWSHFQMRYRTHTLDNNLLHDISEFHEWFRDSRGIRTGLPGTFAKIWMDHVPPKQFQFFFFEDLQSDPEELKRSIFRFLGADPIKPCQLDASQNRKDRPKIEMSDEIRAFLVKQFSDEMRICATVFGGYATKWPEKYGLKRARSGSLAAARPSR